MIENESCLVKAKAFVRCGACSLVLMTDVNGSYKEDFFPDWYVLPGGSEGLCRQPARDVEPRVRSDAPNDFSVFKASKSTA